MGRVAAAQVEHSLVAPEKPDVRDAVDLHHERRAGGMAIPGSPEDLALDQRRPTTDLDPLGCMANLSPVPGMVAINSGTVEKRRSIVPIREVLSQRGEAQCRLAHRAHGYLVGELCERLTVRVRAKLPALAVGGRIGQRVITPRVERHIEADEIDVSELGWTGRQLMNADLAHRRHRMPSVARPSLSDAQHTDTTNQAAAA